MLSRQENEAGCRTGPGTVTGELFRRFWLPAMLPGELPEPDGRPVCLRLLDEPLVASGDSSGQVGIVAENCPHRGASLFFGRNEEGGLRCVYHGWKFEVAGACVEMPNEPAESNFKEKVRATAYPTREWGGVVWVYMGPRERICELPQFEWGRVPETHRNVGKDEVEANYLQVIEGSVDSAHLGFLHTWLDQSVDLQGRPREQAIARIDKTACPRGFLRPAPNTDAEAGMGDDSGNTERQRLDCRHRAYRRRNLPVLEDRLVGRQPLHSGANCRGTQCLQLVGFPDRTGSRERAHEHRYLVPATHSR